VVIGCLSTAHTRFLVMEFRLMVGNEESDCEDEEDMKRGERKKKREEGKERRRRGGVEDGASGSITSSQAQKLQLFWLGEPGRCLELDGRGIGR
jgi:hypothetical protein